MLCVSRTPTFILSIGLAACVATASDLAPECPELVTDWAQGPSDAVILDNNTAYFGSGTVFSIGDINDLISPFIVGRIDLGMLIGDIFVDGEVAYVAAGNFTDEPGALIKLDISDPSSPTLSRICLSEINEKTLFSIGCNYFNFINLEQKRLVQPHANRLVVDHSRGELRSFCHMDGGAVQVEKTGAACHFRLFNVTFGRQKHLHMNGPFPVCCQRPGWIFGGDHIGRLGHLVDDAVDLRSFITGRCV